MACLSRIPQCGGSSSSPSVPEPLPELASILGSIFGIVGIIVTILKGLGAITVTGGVISIGGVTIGTAAAGGAISGMLGGIAVIIVVGMFALNRCIMGDGLSECVAGVISEIVESFSDAWQELFPFTGMHDRVDVVVKSRFWDILESSAAFVFCTVEGTPRRSEIMRCYFYSREVCDAANGALLGSVAGAVGGIIAAAAIAAAIGCATVILCIFALIVAFLVAAAAALIGALIGGQIAKAASEGSQPSDSDTGAALSVGNLVSFSGTRQRRDYDSAAWVMWWVRDASLHGNVTADVPANPFSYCEIDEQLASDSCPLPEQIIK